MSIIVDFHYDYWGDNGRCYESRLEEFPSELCAISDLGITAYNNAIGEVVQVDRVIGGEDGAVERITDAIAKYVAGRKRQDEIAKLKKSNAEHGKWLDSVHDEIVRRTQQIKANSIRLEMIENEQA